MAKLAPALRQQLLIIRAGASGPALFVGAEGLPAGRCFLPPLWLHPVILPVDLGGNLTIILARFCA